MDKSEDQSYDDFRLRKNEIIRGHDSYYRILKDSITVSADFLKAFVNVPGPDTDSVDFTKSPLFTHNVKVGFIIAKKKIRRANFRNRIKRLLKESYRLNRNSSGLLSLKLNILFTLNDRGYVYFNQNHGAKLEFIDTDMKKLLGNIKNKFKITE